MNFRFFYKENCLEFKNFEAGRDFEGLLVKFRVLDFCFYFINFEIFIRGDIDIRVYEWIVYMGNIMGWFLGIG